MVMVSWFTIGANRKKEGKKMLGFMKKEKERTKGDSWRVRNERVREWEGE